MLSPPLPARSNALSASRARLPLGLALALALFGCRSREGFVEEADAEVYRLVHERRGAIFEDELEFDIEPIEGSLRQRLLEGEDAASEPLDLASCLAIAGENSREYQTRKEDLYLDALDLTLEKWRFSVQETGLFGGFLNGEGTEATTVGTTGLGRLVQVLGNGAIWAFDTGFELARNLADGDGFDLVTDLGLSFTQPLLRGGGAIVTREPLTQAERNLVYGVRRYERFRRTFAVQVADRYWRLQQRQDQVRNEEQNFEGLKVLRARNEALADAGRLSDIQVDQARQDEVRSENRLIVLRQSLQRDLDDFKLFLGLPIETDLELARTDLAELRDRTFADRDWEESGLVEAALRERLDFQNTSDFLVDAERRVEVRANDLLAELNLSSGVTAQSDVGSPLTYRSSNVDWQLGFDLDLGLERLPQRNVYRDALIQVQRARRAVEQEADTIRADLRERLRDLRTNAVSYELQSGAVALAERRIESTTLNLEAGRASTRDLLEAQEDLVAAQNNATSALVDYTLSELALYRDLECLIVDEAGIVLREPQIIEP